MCGANVPSVCTQVPAGTLEPSVPQPGLRLLAGQDGQGACPAHEEGQAAGAPGGEAVRSRVLASQGRLGRERRPSL